MARLPPWTLSFFATHRLGRAGRRDGDEDKVARLLTRGSNGTIYDWALTNSQRISKTMNTCINDSNVFFTSENAFVLHVCPGPRVPETLSRVYNKAISYPSRSSYSSTSTRFSEAILIPRTCFGYYHVSAQQWHTCPGRSCRETCHISLHLLLRITARYVPRMVRWQQELKKDPSCRREHAAAGRWSEILDRKRQCNAAISSRDSLPAMYYQTPTKTRHQRTGWRMLSVSNKKHFGFKVSSFHTQTRRGTARRWVNCWPPCACSYRNIGTALLICRCYRMQIVRARLQEWLKARQPQAFVSLVIVAPAA
jgi:hypothetical protein